MKVFISYPHKEHSFVKEMASILEANGFVVFYDDYIAPGSNWSEVLSKELTSAEAVIIVFSEEFNTNVTSEAKMAYARSLSNDENGPLIIPIVIGRKSNIPIELSGIQYISIENSTQLEYIDPLLFALNTYDAKRKKKQEKEQKAEERRDKNFQSFIEPVIERLKESETKNKRIAYKLYVLSAFILILPIIVAIIFLCRTDTFNGEHGSLILTSIVYLIIAILIVSLSRYLFTLANAFMVESIRSSDRIHAISFGRFYLSAFEEEATREEFFKIFSTWNIDNGATIFRTQSSADYDPKLTDLFAAVKK